jgi:hypothetical protein
MIIIISIISIMTFLYNEIFDKESTNLDYLKLFDKHVMIYYKLN